MTSAARVRFAHQRCRPHPDGPPYSGSLRPFFVAQRPENSLVGIVKQNVAHPRSWWLTLGRTATPHPDRSAPAIDRSVRLKAPNTQKLQLLRVLAFHGGVAVARCEQDELAYKHLVDIGYVSARALADGKVQFAVTHNGRAVLNSLND